MTHIEAALARVRELREATTRKDYENVLILTRAAPALLDLLEALLVYIQYGWDDPRKEAVKMQAALAAFVEGKDGA